MTLPKPSFAWLLPLFLLIGLQSCSDKSTSPTDPNPTDTTDTTDTTGTTDTTTTSIDSGRFSNYPVTLVPTSIEISAPPKVFVPNGTGGWNDITTQITELPCGEEFQNIGQVIEWSPVIRFASDTKAEFLNPTDPSVAFVATYQRNGFDYTIPFPEYGFTYYGRKSGDHFYVPHLMICQIEDQGSGRSISLTSIPVESRQINVKSLEQFAGDTVVYQFYELKYEKE